MTPWIASPDAAAQPYDWPLQALREALEPLLPGFTAEAVAEIDSTNSELMRRARAGQHQPVMLLAEHQTAGRGRMGRRWCGAAGGALTFSLGLRLSPAAWSGLSLAVGVSVAEQLHPEVRLKWPNDLWLDGRKLGGILVETSTTSDASEARYAVMGVGLNLAPPPPTTELRTPPAWLGELMPLDAGRTLLQVLVPLVRDVLVFESQGFAAFRDRFEARDALRGSWLAASDGTAGTGSGVNEAGALLVHTANGLRAITSAEVSVRPG